MQYYTVHHKEYSTYMEIWHRGWWFKLRPQLPVCFGFTINGVCQRIEFCVWLLRFEMPMALMWQKGTSYRSLPFDGFWALSGYCAALLSNKELLGRLSETRFDVAIVDLLYNECGLAIPHSLGEGFIATIAPSFGFLKKIKTIAFAI